MGKIERLLVAVVILAVIIVIALRGCPRRTHFRSERSQGYNHIAWTFSSTVSADWAGPFKA